MYCSSPSDLTRLSRSALYFWRSASGSKSMTNSSGGVAPSIWFPLSCCVVHGPALERLTNLEHAPILLSTPDKSLRQQLGEPVLRQRPMRRADGAAKARIAGEHRREDGVHGEKQIRPPLGRRGGDSARWRPPWGRPAARRCGRGGRRTPSRPPPGSPAGRRAARPPAHLRRSPADGRAASASRPRRSGPTDGRSTDSETGRGCSRCRRRRRGRPCAAGWGRCRRASAVRRTRPGPGRAIASATVRQPASSPR